jgi:hypothetical protein
MKDPVILLRLFNEDKPVIVHGVPHALSPNIKSPSICMQVVSDDKSILLYKAPAGPVQLGCPAAVLAMTTNNMTVIHILFKDSNKSPTLFFEFMGVPTHF